MSNKIKLQNAKLPTIDPAEVVFLFADNKPYAWRGEQDEIIEATDPRYDERVELAVPEATILNIMELGVREPVLLHQVDGKTYKVDGLQRLKATRIANERLAKAGEPVILVPYILVSGKDDGQLASLRVSLNSHRTDDSMLTNARNAERLINVHGWTKPQAAVYFRVSVPAISNWLRLMKCSQKVLKAVEKNRIASTTAMGYADLEHKEQDQRLTEDLAAIENENPAAPAKRVSATKIKQRKEPETEPAEVVEKRLMTKARNAIDALTPEQRLALFAEYDERGEEKPLISTADIEAGDEDLTEDDVKELAVELDEDAPTEEVAPAKKSRKRK